MLLLRKSLQDLKDVNRDICYLDSGKQTKLSNQTNCL
ncbi:hypothetical protein ES319_D04G071400v1 [Gossypium barbadense]|uniref:Uncharacterized protein n=2 Tax=Gossypium TaxID=3633 RepID=A0A5J5RSU8_GOSBA|nr:hypothetical protein ES319_D04G071400v1 [Gossypium barbadense]TYG73120.1 hypothetical protein ES288_D04G075000v1 [Gossypium darwinii]